MCVFVYEKLEIHNQKGDQTLLMTFMTPCFANQFWRKFAVKFAIKCVVYDIGFQCTWYWIPTDAKKDIFFCTKLHYPLSVGKIDQFFGLRMLGKPDCEVWVIQDPLDLRRYWQLGFNQILCLK